MLIRTKALLLNSIPVGESDLLAVFFTERLGKVRALAKGALRSKKRFLGILLNLNELEVELAQTRGKEIEFRLSLADLLQSRLNLSRDPLRLGSAYALAELAERAAPEQEPSAGLYRVLARSIDDIQSKKNFREYCFHSLLTILSLLGYMPALQNCAVCGKKLPAGQKSWFFSIERGGFVCEQDAKREANLMELSPGLAQSLSALGRPGGKGPARVRLSKKDFAAGVHLFFDFTAWHLGKPLNSLAFLKSFSTPAGTVAADN